MTALLTPSTAMLSRIISLYFYLFFFSAIVSGVLGSMYAQVNVIWYKFV